MQPARKQLRKYDERRTAKREAVGSGVACTEMLCGLHSKPEKHNARQYAAEWWTVEHEKNYVPCPGEMMYDQPERVHPELRELRAATCENCGWHGWVEAPEAE